MSIVRLDGLDLSISNMAPVTFPEYPQVEKQLKGTSQLH